MAVASSESVIGSVALGLKVLIRVTADGIIVVNAGEKTFAWTLC
jgi:hypothetical protein